MKVTGERFIPLRMQKQAEVEHMHRYLAAQGIVNDMVLLDAACGTGYGSNILSQQANRVYGIDISEEAIKYARENYGKDNIEFIQASIEKLPFDDKFFDAVVSFETIEHVDEELQNYFLNEISRVLKDDGILIMSTPNKKVYTDDASGIVAEWHIREFYEDEYMQFMKQKFKYVHVFNQYICRTSQLVSGKEKLLKPLNYDSERKGKFFITIASNRELAETAVLDSTYYYPDIYTYINDSIQLYYRKENEVFKEENCEVVEISNDCADMKNRISLDGEKAKYIRIDPLTVSCELTICKITVRLMDGTEVEVKKFVTNADVIKEEQYTFYHSDPQILIELEEEREIESVLLDIFINNHNLNLYPLLVERNSLLTRCNSDLMEREQELKELQIQNNEYILLYCRKENEIFTEENCEREEILNDSVDIKNRISLDGKRAKYIRIDPLTVSCELTICKITVRLMDGTEVEVKKFVTNADVIKEEQYTFYHSNPQILLELEEESEIESVLLDIFINNHNLNLYPLLVEKNSLLTKCNNDIME